jgi:LuxR family maltose regulon positive regulatory protein
MGIEELTADDMAVLDKRIEGWITGLRLAALTLRNTTDRESFIRRFRGMVDSLIAEYLAAEVLAVQEPEVQEFLLCTSILDRYCAPLCEAIVVTVNGRFMLEELLRANLFVISLDQEGKWYRYHHLFQDLLQRRLRESRDMTEIQALHSQASVWLASRDLIDEALRHALAAGDVESAVRMVEGHRVSLLNREDWRLLQRWLDQLPREAVIASPALTLARAWIGVYHFDPVAIHSLLERAERILNERLKELPPDEASALQGEIDALYSYFLQTFDTKPELSLTRAEHALDRLPREFSIARGLAQDFKAFALQASGRLDEAIRLLEDIIGDPLQPGGVKAQAYIALCFVYFGAGDLKALATTASQFISFTSDLKALPSFAWANYFAGQAAYEWNDLQQAIEYLSVVADLEKHAVFVTYHNSILLLAKTYWALARKAEAQEIIRSHEHKLGESGNPAFNLQVDALKAQFALDIADLDGAARWAQQADPMMFVEPMFIDEIVSQYWARILTESANTIGLKAVRAFLEQRLALVESRHRIPRQIKILAQLSLVHYRLGQTAEAMRHLRRSLLSAHPHGFHRTFIDLGEDMAGLLGHLVTSASLDESLKRYATQLITACSFPDTTTSLIDDTWQRAQLATSDALTRRESEVLLLLAEQLKYREIAQSLVISMPTTKKHISHIYAKLGVKSREEAIDRAIALGILV